MGILRAKNTLLTAAALLAARPAAQALDLQRERHSPFDLAVSGRLAGLPAGETRYVPWAELRGLPTTKLRLRDEFTPGEQEVTVVFLADLWRELPHAAGADVLLATCGDGYASVYRAGFIAEYRPFLVLEINGQGPEHWPPPGLKFNPGPYVITVSAALVPGVAALLDPGHKKPWGVERIEVANYFERFHAAYAGAWAHLSARAEAGREIWVNSCASCHAGPGTMFGGTKSGQAFAVLAAVASANPDFFKAYIRHPQALVPTAKMEAHPHYTDPQLAALVAFVTAERP